MCVFMVVFTYSSKQMLTLHEAGKQQDAAYIAYVCMCVCVLLAGMLLQIQREVAIICSSCHMYHMRQCVATMRLPIAPAETLLL